MSSVTSTNFRFTNWEYKILICFHPCKQKFVTFHLFNLTIGWMLFESGNNSRKGFLIFDVNGNSSKAEWTLLAEQFYKNIQSVMYFFLYKYWTTFVCGVGKLMNVLKSQCAIRIWKVYFFFRYYFGGSESNVQYFLQRWYFACNVEFFTGTQFQVFTTVCYRAGKCGEIFMSLRA